MATEANVYQQEECSADFTAAAAITGGQVVQCPDGRAGVVPSAVSAGNLASAQQEGIYDVTATSAEVWLPGTDIYWDASANTATCVPQFAALDFWIGTAVGGKASGDTTGKVYLNRKSQPIVSLRESGADSVIVKTSGTPYGSMVGGLFEMGFSATAEAQKIDWLSCRSVPITGNWILSAVVEVKTNADDDVADLSIGVANATHASDADSITESAFFHLDMGGSLNILAESDDGTTEVVATDTTVDWVVGTPVLLQIDGRDETDLQYYVNGVNVLPGTTFTLAAGTGPIKVLLHLEKSANDSPGIVQIHDCSLLIANE